MRGVSFSATRTAFGTITGFADNERQLLDLGRHPRAARCDLPRVTVASRRRSIQNGAVIIHPRQRADRDRGSEHLPNRGGSRSLISDSTSPNSKAGSDARLRFLGAMEPTTPADPNFSVEWTLRPARIYLDYHCEFMEADDKLRRKVTSPPHSSEPATSHGPARPASARIRRLSADPGRPYSPHSDRRQDAGQPPPAHRQPRGAVEDKVDTKHSWRPDLAAFFLCLANNSVPVVTRSAGGRWPWPTARWSSASARSSPGLTRLRQCLSSISKPLTVVFNRRQFGDATTF
jgi:hypothetical protein